MTEHYIIHRKTHFPRVSVKLQHEILMKRAANDSNTHRSVLSEPCLWATIVTSLLGDFLRCAVCCGGYQQLRAPWLWSGPAIDFLRFELITCFTRETGLRWNPLRSPLILQKLPHGLADGFREMCFPIENNYTGDGGAGTNPPPHSHSEHFKTAIGEVCDLT